MIEFSRRKFLILGGTSKAGTTSLFEFLKSHPDVCASTIKETRFFLDDEYPLPRESGFHDGISAYRAFFSAEQLEKAGSVCLEATPDYLYCKTPRRIPEWLPDSRFVFILRNPVDRIESWYRYAFQLGRLKRHITLEEYCRRQLDAAGDSHRDVEWRVVEQGRYAAYLASWFKDVPRDRIRVELFDDLVADPQAVVTRICRFAGIDERFYGNFAFASHNVTTGVRSQALAGGYNWLRRTVAYTFLRMPRVWRRLQAVNQILKRAMRYNEAAVEKAELPVALRRRLAAYYAGDRALLEQMLDRKLDAWRT